MKKNIYFSVVSILSLLFMSAFAQVYAQWHEVELPMENEYNTIVHYWDSVNVLFVQADGDAAYSTDGGSSWDNPYYPHNSPHLNGYIDFHKDYGYSTAGNFGEPGNYIYKFSKPGRDFDVIGTVKHDIQFGYHEEIYFYSDDVAVFRRYYYESDQDQGWRLYKTNNGGEVWERRRSFPQTNLEQVYIVSDNDYYAYFDNKSMQKSDSNIVSWKSIGFKPNNRYYFQMPEMDVGYYAAADKLYKTSNKWSDKSEILNTESNGGEISCLNFQDINTGWIGTRSGKLFGTNDGGQNWFEDTLANIPFDYKLVGVQCIDFNKAVIKVRNKDDDDKAFYYKNFGKLPNNIVEYHKADVKVFPNPADTYIIVSKSPYVTLNGIYDAAGDMSDELEANTDVLKYSIDVSNLPSGVYFLNYSFHGKVFNHKFILEK